MLNCIAKTKVQCLLLILIILGGCGFFVDIFIRIKYGANQMLNISGGISAFVAGFSLSLINPFDNLRIVYKFLATNIKLIITFYLCYGLISSAIGFSSELLLTGMAIIPIIVWIILSYYAKNSMAIIINEILTIIVTIVIFSDDVVLELLNIENSVLEAKKFLDIILLLMMIANGTATVVCLIKKYNIEEKKNGVDPFDIAYEKYKEELSKELIEKNKPKSKIIDLFKKIILELFLGT